MKICGNFIGVKMNPIKTFGVTLCLAGILGFTATARRHYSLEQKLSTYKNNLQYQAKIEEGLEGTLPFSLASGALTYCGLLFYKMDKIISLMPSAQDERDGE